MKNKLLISFVVVILLVFVSCRKENSEIDNPNMSTSISEMIEIQENAINILNNQSIEGQSGETIINNCVQQLLSNPEVSSASVLEPDQIVIRYKSGITSVIFFIDKGAVEKKKDIIKPISQSNKNLGSEVQIENKKVLIWAAWDDVNVSNDLKNIFDNCSDINFTVDVKRSDECTLQSLFNLTQYGYVHLETHGGAYPNAHGEMVSWLLTREQCSSSELSNEDVTSERKILVTTVGVEFDNNQEIRRFSKEGHYWGVTNKFISKYVTGTFSSPSVVFIQACHSFDNSSLRDVFINEKKASVYLGYTHSVTYIFGYAKAIEFATNMLQRRLSALDAYDAIDELVDNTVWQFAEWYFDPNWTIQPRAVLMCSSREDPTYFASEANTVTCENLGISMPLNCNYSTWDLWCQGISHSAADFIYAVNIHFRTSQCNNPFHAGDYHTAYAYTFDEFVNFDAFDTLGIRVFANGIVESQACSYVQS